MRRELLCCAVTLAAAGCATLEQPISGHRDSASPAVRECAGWFAALDAAVDEASVRDAQEARIPGFPYLRVNRFLAAMRGEAAAHERALQDWVGRLLELDRAARRVEIANLPRERLAPLAEGRDAFAVRFAEERTEECGRLLRALDLAQPQARAALLERATVPDDYSSARRVLGLYALTRAPFARGVRRYEEEQRAAFAREPAVPAGGTVVRYAPPPAAARSREEMTRLLDAASDNSLGVPLPTESALERLFAAYAPSFDIEVTGDDDRFGALRWESGDPVPEVNPTELAVYRHPAWTRYHGHVLLQLVYTLWFPERPPESPRDILSGKLDGVVWRVTLAPDGEPLVFDAMHPCGCYHLFFPTARAEPLPAPDALEEWVFAPQRLPRLRPGERPLVRIAARTHYIERVSIVQGSDSLARYELRPYDALRSLERPGGAHASIFGPDGIVAGTERAERALFWPMGIRSPGAMRQWGRHATAFVGRRHFDDADLFERRFRFDLP